MCTDATAVAVRDCFDMLNILDLTSSLGPASDGPTQAGTGKSHLRAAAAARAGPSPSPWWHTMIMMARPRAGISI